MRNKGNRLLKHETNKALFYLRNRVRSLIKKVIGVTITFFEK